MGLTEKMPDYDDNNDSYDDEDVIIFCWRIKNEK